MTVPGFGAQAASKFSLRFCWSLALLPVASGACQAQAFSGTLDSLARAWSSGTVSPACAPIKPAGASPGTLVCDWTNPSRPAAGKVSTIRNAQDSHSVMWERAFTGASDAKGVVDSLATQFSVRGLKSRSCAVFETPTGTATATLWVGDSLVVYITNFSGQSPPFTLLVMAFTNPTAAASLPCPPPESTGASDARGRDSQDRSRD